MIFEAVWNRIEGKPDKSWNPDQANFMWFSRFFLEFNRVSQEQKLMQGQRKRAEDPGSFDVSFVSIAIHEDVFAWIFYLLERYPVEKEWKYLVSAAGYVKELVFYFILFF